MGSDHPYQLATRDALLTSLCLVDLFTLPLVEAQLERGGVPVDDDLRLPLSGIVDLAVAEAKAKACVDGEDERACYSLWHARWVRAGAPQASELRSVRK